MRRRISAFLDDWLLSADRKPLVIRGARQVGKTWLVRNLARRHGRRLVEVNLERRPELADHFGKGDVRRAVADLGTDLGIAIRSEESLLFLDEIQAAPSLLAYLRWFREEMPELPVIAAGSLLDFALREHDFSMPVGRISFGYVEPMSFYEFLDASGNERLKWVLEGAAAGEMLSDRLHERALELFSEYCLVGGLPEVVAEWIEHRDPERCLRLQRDLVTTYREDFNKYRERIHADLLRRVMDAIPHQLGRRFVYTRVDAESGHREMRKALTLLTLARVCHRVIHSAANGLPLGAETNPRLFKVLLVDVGLVSAQLGLRAMDLRKVGKTIWANRGGLAEQFVGQHLRCLFRPWEDPQLYYWQRTGGRPGEIDYIMQHGSRIVPIEVKAGSAGAMKSLHAFVGGKGLDVAVRLDTNPPSLQEIDVRTTTGERVRYRLVSFPLYMAESLPAGIERTAP